jgi:predicted nucleic acid-binding protein
MTSVAAVPSADRPRFPSGPGACESAIPCGPSEAARAADLYRTLSGARGREIDLAIADCAIGRDARLWTLDVADFEHIPGLELYRPA